MKVVGLITEYNPFHNGHLYHMQKAKEITGADAALVLMSGDYVQRGAPAVMPKHLRAEIALGAGVPVILELPVCFACGSAEYFAAGAISLFEKLGCIDAVCFGSECGDLDILTRIAQVTADEPEAYRRALQEALRSGMSFPRARQSALKAYLKDDRIDAVISQPNNILGIEYIKALYQKKSPIEIYTIKRMVSGYHDDCLTRQGYSSASAIRKLLAHAGNSLHMESAGPFDEPALSEVLCRLEDQVPPSCIRLLEETHRSRYPVYANDFSLLIKYKLLTETAESLMQYMDVNEELARRILRHANDFTTFEQFCDLLKTRDVTHTRISRCLFHILLGITADNLQEYRKEGFSQYARILGFRKDSTHILSYLKRHSAVPLITKLTQTAGLSDTGLKMLRQDIFAANLYESVVTDKYKLPFINEHCQQLVRI